MSRTRIIAVSVPGHGYLLIDTYSYESNPPEIIARLTTANDIGYVAPTAYDDPDIICYLGTGPSALTAEVALEDGTRNLFKNDEMGLLDTSAVPGTWASNELIGANFSRALTIPSNIKSGNYVLRHGIITLHGEGTFNPAGTATTAGTPETELCRDADPGIYVSIWNSLSRYEIPGLALFYGHVDFCRGFELFDQLSNR
ncbi:hypothetical protein BJY00DRAFT_304644 [Aspergillus carlsbadensis]|nr:hypothetical protein BJY00DRAFT_304644 [Aspergillus carlsbadensis]